MQGFAHVRIPLPARAGALSRLPMFMVWHQRYQKDPAHLWLRQELENVCRLVTPKQDRQV
jgi:hypothetical protein